MMRDALAGLRARVERASAHLQRSCRHCRDLDEDRVLWGAMPSDAPTVETCAECGRIVSLRYVVLRWKTDEEDTAPCR